MQNNNETYQAYRRILRRELIPAMGCTEPVAISWGAAMARDVLGEFPDKVVAEVSGNIIKNAKSVVVPNTNGMRGIPAAIAAGIVAGKVELGLEVISEITDTEREKIRSLLDMCEIQVTRSASELILDFTLLFYASDRKVQLRICNEHTNVIYIEKDGKVMLHKPINEDQLSVSIHKDYDRLNVADIIDFTSAVQIDDVSEWIERQIAFNTAIAEEGLRNDYGANIGKVLLSDKDEIRIRAKAVAAAASDARMSGCALPVIVLSGSGNQGIAASLPVIEYAKYLKVDREKLIRAIVLSDLITLHQKRYIGRLSAYCGVVCAGAACGAGITYLYGGGYEDIAHTIVNALAMTSGIICDGAKPSCAAKIALAVEAGILGHFMYRDGQQFYSGDGIVKEDVEKTIRTVGILGCEGMRETDAIILNLMMKDGGEAEMK